MSKSEPLEVADSSDFRYSTMAVIRNRELRNRRLLARKLRNRTDWRSRETFFTPFVPPKKAARMRLADVLLHAQPLSFSWYCPQNGKYGNVAVL